MTTLHTQHDSSVEKLARLLEGFRMAMLSTVSAQDGTMHSRPMATQNVPFDGTLWFFTYADSGKVHEIGGDQHVNVSYVDASKNTYVSVSGRASVVRDKAKAKELWTPYHKVWFPDGLDDPRLALIRVDVTDAEFWDGPSSKVVQLYGLVKGVVTGRPPTDMDDNQKIHLSPT